MNHVLKAGAETASHGWVMGALTVVFLGCFVFWIWWAYADRHRAAMDEASRLPLTEGGER